jgi:hypothetical protein
MSRQFACGKFKRNSEKNLSLNGKVFSCDPISGKSAISINSRFILKDGSGPQLKNRTPRFGLGKVIKARRLTVFLPTLWLKQP